MDGVKSFLKSTGVMGPLIAIIAWGAKKAFGIDVGAADIQPIIDNGLLVAGAIAGLVGRIRATKQIGLTDKPGASP